MLRKSDSAKSQVAAPKRYHKPTLTKGPTLSVVTAAGSTVSGISQDQLPE
jgi:hypothetical protein